MTRRRRLVARLRSWFTRKPPSGSGGGGEPNTWAHHRARAHSEYARNQNWSP